MQWLEPHAAGHPDDLSLMQLQYGSFSSSSTSSGSHLDLHMMAEEDGGPPPEPLQPSPHQLRPPPEADQDGEKA
eukprot:3722121-Prymnesium_polylepis.1